MKTPRTHTDFLRGKKRSLGIAWCAGSFSLLFFCASVPAETITIRDLPGDSVSTTLNPESVAVSGAVEVAGPIEAYFPPQKDNTLYEDSAGQLSNGLGFYFFLGRTNGNLLRRGLVAFDLSSIPTNATITGAGLRMRLSRLEGGAAGVSLHKALRAWGEGGSHAGDPGADGTQAAANDATWLHNFYNTSFWSTPGGDFSLTPSSTVNVSVANGSYTWTGAALRADVQEWVSNPGNNFGWIIRGDETTPGKIQRFDSREHPLSNHHALLTVIYQVGPRRRPPAVWEISRPAFAF